MTPTQYIKAALRTLSGHFQPLALLRPHGVTMAEHLHQDVIHAVMGISTESGEMLSVVKANLFYGRGVDYVNLDEEIGDVMWYVALYCAARGLPLEAIMAKNIAKLEKRFPEKFTTKHANERDLDAERKVLEAEIVAKPDEETIRSCPVRRRRMTEPSPTASSSKDPAFQAGEATSKLAGVLAQGLREDNASTRGEIAIKLRVAASRIQHGAATEDEGIERGVFVDGNGNCKPGRTIAKD